MKKLLLSVVVLALSLFLISPVSASDPAIIEQLSATSVLVRGYGIHGFTFQDSSFESSFPSSCFDDSLGDVYWYAKYRLNDESNPGGELNLETPHTAGHYPASGFDYTVNFPGTYHQINSQYLVQHCSNGSENQAILGAGYDLHIHAQIARDIGVLWVDTGNTLDIYGITDERVPFSNYLWDLNNDSAFETTGRDIIYSAIGISAGDHPITFKATDAFGATAQETFPVSVLDHPVTLTNVDGQSIPNQVTESLGFSDVEESLVEDGIGAIQDASPEFSYIKYDLPSAVYTPHQISSIKVTIRAKNAGTVSSSYGVFLIGDVRSTSIDNCLPEMAPSGIYQNYVCSIKLPDHIDERQKFTGVQVNFGGIDGTDVHVNVDSVKIDYTFKEALLNMPISAGGPYEVITGQNLEVTASSIVPDDDHLAYFWDLDADGIFDRASTERTMTLNTESFVQGEYPLKVQVVSDGGGKRVSAETTFTVADEVEPITIDAGGPYTVTEGSSIQLDATSSDPNASSYTYTWDLDNDGSFETTGQSVPYDATSIAAGIYTVKVKATSPSNVSAEDEATVTVTSNIQTMIIDPGADSYVDQDHPNQNYGSETMLFSDNSPKKISYMRFNLDPLAGKTIVSASLRLKVNDPSSVVQSLRLADTTTWTETGVDYNNRPLFDSTITTFMPSVNEGVYNLDVASAVDTRKGNKMTLGVATSTGTDRVKFYSRNAATATNRPQLTVQYTD